MALEKNPQKYRLQCTLPLPVDNFAAMTAGPDDEVGVIPQTAPGSPWALDAVRVRIEKRMGELGKTPRSMPGGYRKGWGDNGPSLRLLGEVAYALDWTVPELLGIRVADPKILALAVQAVNEMTSRRAMGDCPLQQPEKTAELLSEAYAWFDIFLRHAPEVETQRALQSIALQIKARFSSGQSEN